MPDLTPEQKDAYDKIIRFSENFQKLCAQLGAGIQQFSESEKGQEFLRNLSNFQENVEAAQKNLIHRKIERIAHLRTHQEHSTEDGKD